MDERTFYKNIIAIDKEAHKDLRIKLNGDYNSFSNTNALPIAGVEFIEAAREHAIAFINYMDEGVIPVYILGLRDNENLLLNHDGSWKYQYTPAFVRRYPYIMVEPNEDGKSIICVDADYDGLNDPEGERIFIEDSDGEPTPQLEAAIEMLRDYQAQLIRTREFSKRLEDFGLLHEIAPQIDMHDGRTFTIGGLLAVDEQKMLELDDEKALTLYRSGEMSWIYNHLASLSNLIRMAELVPADSDTTTDSIH